MASSIKIIGIGDNGKESLLPIYEKWIYESELLLGGERQLAFFPDYEGEKIVIKNGLSKLVNQLSNEKRNTVILASGDPLFFGIGSYLASKLHNVEIFPYLSSIQLAFAKIGERWHDAKFISLHGRSIKGLAQKIDGEDKVAILTDEENNPALIAKYLLNFGISEYEAFVCEHLGGEKERCRKMTIEEMADEQFLPLNIVILKKVSNSPDWPLGIEDEEFFQRKPDKGLITKKEIRTLSLAALKIKKDSVVWDIGTCTGSVAIEAARIAKDGAVFAIEKNEKDLENCYENMKKFRADFTVIHGKAPDGLEQFSDPDAVFIGGTAGNIDAIIDICAGRLRKNGRIVLNAATIETLSKAVECLKRNQFHVEITLVQISKSKPILDLTRFEALNPIYIITASKN
ncbi:precorrin-6y C5,15-methyltransferase (decarboxylating) subunit CbiE [Calidifontibacillus erzurumensis]|uniref:Precorrin-6y C5,15-methyltransferase (Decarboxylating) subunit CbiE n=1 Tax=Calidifontibacillus erzurumensis TaxID=2741433 RepID=A0A8J8GC42_9BACI|nr:precorrin-6y C5,15-methyltransferase (decarboxylating) subunit CbiE [Calidifontibacillus erzurumensis]NSL50682.1 precorrin-6y C5,15-methyltransferase (decarboxylating) subunit CbiE [Calidifontibacillus erzurumensis]